MTSTDLTAVREAVAKAIEVEGLLVTPRYTGKINSPQAVVVRRQTTFDPAFDIDADHQLAIRLFVSFADLAGSQERIDQWCSPDGENSIRACIDADPTLGGIVDSCRIPTAEDERITTFAGIDYLTVDLPLEVL